MVKQEYEFFIEIMERYYQTQTDFDIYDEEDVTSVLADYAEKSASFINYVLHIDNEEYYTLTQKGREYLEKFERVEELEKKLSDGTILLTEYKELELLKKEL